MAAPAGTAGASRVLPTYNWRRVSEIEYRIREYPLQQGALEIAYIEEFFNEFPKRKSAPEIETRLAGREMQILMAEVPLPEDPSVYVPVSYKVSHELRAEEADPAMADLVDRLRDVVEFRDRRILYNWLGATRRDWRGQGHFRAVSEQQEVWAFDRGFDEIIVKTKNRYYDMRAALARLEFNVIKVEQTSDDPGDAKVYLSKRVSPEVRNLAQRRI
jgi:hypothetical protein